MDTWVWIGQYDEAHNRVRYDAPIRSSLSAQELLKELERTYGKYTKKHFDGDVAVGWEFESTMILESMPPIEVTTVTYVRLTAMPLL